MYDKVSPNLNFVEREKKTEKFWEDITFSKRVLMKEKKERFILSMTDLRLQTVNRISVRFNACYQGYDSALPYNERLQGTS